MTKMAREIHSDFTSHFPFQRPVVAVTVYLNFLLPHNTGQGHLSHDSLVPSSLTYDSHDMTATDKS